MHSSNPTNRWPVFGVLSLVLGPLVVLLTFFFMNLTVGALEPRWFNEYPQYILQYVWLVLLAGSLVTSVIGCLKGEQPRWLPLGASTLALSLLFFLTMFLHWLEE